MNEELRKLVNIATDVNMFPEVLKSLYGTLKDKEEYNVELRRGLSINVNCPVDVLEKLIKDDVDDIRINAAKHSRATEKMLSACIKDDNRFVRIEAVKNKNVSEDILIAFIKDEDVEIVRTARAILKSRL